MQLSGWLSTLLFLICSNIYAAQSTPPKITYVLVGDGSKIYASIDELVNDINSKQEANFSACISTPNILTGGYSCAKYIIVAAIPSPVFPTTYNGVYTYLSLERESTTVSKATAASSVQTFVTPVGGLGANARVQCDPELYMETTGTAPNFTAVCKPFYIAVSPDSNPSTQCTAGNPIDTSTGAKIQKETDIYSRGINQVTFERTYNNGNKSESASWFNLYQKNLRIITPEKIVISGKKSSPAISELAACTNGWNQIKSNITESWAQGSTAQYVNDTCQIKRNNIIVRNLPILPNVNNLHITLKPGSIQLVRENGSIFSFGLSTNDQYRELNGERGSLIAIADSAPITWRFTTNGGDIEDYNADGKLLSITAKNGVKQELFYDSTSGLLSRVKDSTGRELLFAYTGNQISSVTVDGTKTTNYTYNALGLITQVTRPDNTTRIYHYEDTRFPTSLTGITDERGARYATWTYDAQGRAISSEHAGGAEKTLLAFNADGSTTVTNALNKQTIYRFSDIAGARRVTKVEGQPTTNCLGANQDYTYTPEGWVASKTDWKGIKTTFTYNTAGQEISRTEAFGTPEARTTITEWHPTLFVKTKITGPAKETIYNYDASGRLLNQSTYSITVQ